MGPEYQRLSPAQSCRSLILEPSECFICREVELATSDRLRNFCDCKTLVAHHACLSTWIQTRRGSEDRLLCVVCKAEYQVQRRSPWWSLGSEWRSWLVLVPALVLLALVPYVVHCLMTAFTKPPPPISFKVAAVTFGLLTEFLLIKCVSRYLSTRYCQAERSAFTVRARGSEEDRPGPDHQVRPGPDHRDRAGPDPQARSEAPAAAAGQASSDDCRVDILKSGCVF